MRTLSQQTPEATGAGGPFRRVDWSNPRSRRSRRQIALLASPPNETSPTTLFLLAPADRAARRCSPPAAAAAAAARPRPRRSKPAGADGAEQKRADHPGRRDLRRGQRRRRLGRLLGRRQLGPAEQVANLYANMVASLEGLGAPKEKSAQYDEFAAAANELAKAEGEVKLAAEREDAAALAKPKPRLDCARTLPERGQRLRLRKLQRRPERRPSVRPRGEPARRRRRSKPRPKAKKRRPKKRPKK